MLWKNTLIVGLFVGGMGGDSFGQDTQIVPVDSPEVTAKDAMNSMWGGVFERSGKTVKAGQYMGIGGGASLATGVLIMAIASPSSFKEKSGRKGKAKPNAGGGNKGGHNAGGAAIAGKTLSGLGYLSFTAGPALVAGGSIRQNNALRMTHPHAPAAKLGYASWGLWGAGRALWFAPPPIAGLSLLTDVSAYIVGSIQYGRNRTFWDAQAQAKAAQGAPGWTVSLAPIEVDGHRGLALVGTF